MCSAQDESRSALKSPSARSASRFVSLSRSLFHSDPTAAPLSALPQHFFPKPRSRLPQRRDSEGFFFAISDPLSGPSSVGRIWLHFTLSPISCSASLSSRVGEPLCNLRPPLEPLHWLRPSRHTHTIIHLVDAAPFSTFRLLFLLLSRSSLSLLLFLLLLCLLLPPLSSSSAFCPFLSYLGPL